MDAKSNNTPVEPTTKQRAQYLVDHGWFQNITAEELESILNREDIVFEDEKNNLTGWV